MIIDLKEFAPEPEQCFYSVGAVCQHLQVTPKQLRVLMEAAEVKFAKIIDSVAYFDFPGFDAVNSKCAEVQTEINKVRASVHNN